jgi:hypothetical protein
MLMYSALLVITIKWKTECKKKVFLLYISKKCRQIGDIIKVTGAEVCSQETPSGTWDKIVHECLFYTLAPKKSWAVFVL